MSKLRPPNRGRRKFLSQALLAGGGLIGTTALAKENHEHHMSDKTMHKGNHSMHGNMQQYETMMFMPGHSMHGGVIEPPGAPDDKSVKYKEFTIEVDVIQHEIVPGVKAHMFAFNGQVPGPLFRVMEGDWIKVNFKNNTEEMHTIHWHGLTVPYTMDGVPMVTQDPVHPGQTFVYRFQAKPAGTRWYHCHWSTPLHAGHGMHGAFIIDKKKDPLKKKYPYRRDYTLVLESWDINFSREEINGLLEGMKQVNTLMAQGKLDPATHGFFKNYAEFKQAVDSGEYIPPYLLSRSSGVEIKHNFFGINGKAYPATERLIIKKGEWIRVRLINAGTLSHHMHLHGHDFWWVAQDGNDLAEPRRLNTIHVEPGGTYDIMIYGDNPGYWTFHDHNTQHVRNNGIYPGGMLTLLEYEGFTPSYKPSLSVDQ